MWLLQVDKFLNCITNRKIYSLHEQEVEKENDNKESEEGQNDFSVDVDEELQTELCKLWDMSMNSVRQKLVKY